MPCISEYTRNLKGACKYSLWVNGPITVAVYSINQSQKATERPEQTENSSMISSLIRHETNRCPTVSPLNHTSAGSLHFVYLYDNKVRFPLSYMSHSWAQTGFMTSQTIRIETCNLIYFMKGVTVFNTDCELSRFCFPS